MKLQHAEIEREGKMGKRILLYDRCRTEFLKSGAYSKIHRERLKERRPFTKLELLLHPRHSVLITDSMIDVFKFYVKG